MQRNFLVPLLVILTAVGAGSIAVLPLLRQSQQVFAGSPGGLELQIKAARAANKTTLQLPAPMPLPPEVPTFSDALQNYTLIRSVVSASKTILVDQQLRTYYKLSVLEMLSRQPKIEGDLLLTGTPKELLPVAESEVILRTSGGELWIDGVLVKQAPSEVDYYELQIGKEYLVAVYLENGGASGVSAAGAATILSIDLGELKPFRRTHNIFFDDIERLFNGRLDALVDFVRRN